MPNETDRPSLPVLLLESEVAERLRCSKVTVRRLRSTGQLAYIPGRPIRISEADLADYIERQRIAVEASIPTPESLKRAAEAADQRRIGRYWLKRRLKAQ